MADTAQMTDWRGHTVVDQDGDKIGRIDEIYLDEQTGKPEWMLVNTGLFGMKSTFIPLAQANEEGDDIRVPYEKSHVQDAPGVEQDGRLSQAEEAELYRHYDLDYSEERSGSGLPEGQTDGGERGPVGHDTSGPTTDDAMTRSEEELHVGTAERERGRVRLRKHVVTDEVQKTVPVKREEVRVEREPITEGNVDQATDGPAISDEEHEVVLSEEEVVTEKRAVPKERVRLDKDVVTEDRQVSEDVRREEIEVDGDR